MAALTFAPGVTDTQKEAALSREEAEGGASPPRSSPSLGGRAAYSPHASFPPPLLPEAPAPYTHKRGTGGTGGLIFDLLACLIYWGGGGGPADKRERPYPSCPPPLYSERGTVGDGLLTFRDLMIACSW